MAPKNSKYVQVSLGLPPRKLFDYLIPVDYLSQVQIGSRVKVPFRDQILVGYCVGFSQESRFQDQIKPFHKLIDPEPVLDSKMLKLAENIADYYFCSFGEAIETLLPSAIRKGKQLDKMVIQPSDFKQAEINLDKGLKEFFNSKDAKPIVVVNSNERALLEIYKKALAHSIYKGKSAIIILPDRNKLNAVYEAFKKEFEFEIAVISTTQKESENFREWLKIKSGRARIVLGTRSAVFAPLKDLGLIIIDDEQNDIYKQEEKPFYQTKEIASMRCKIEKAKLILGTHFLSAEAFYNIGKKNYNMVDFTRGPSAEIQIVDLRHAYKRSGFYISKPLELKIEDAFKNSKSALIFYNRRGFSGFVTCKKCGHILSCRNCSSPLIYYREEKLLLCHHCNYKEACENLCPKCKENYLNYQGAGLEKIENLLYGFFPDAKIVLADSKIQPKTDAKFDILIGTQAAFKFIRPESRVWISAVLSLEQLINIFDFRSTEKAFNLITKLLSFTESKLVIQTFNPDHYLSKSLAKKDFSFFYKEELKLRRQLKIPPFYHILEICLRDTNEAKLVNKINLLFNQLKFDLPKEISVVGPIQDRPYRLRSKYRQKLIIKAKSRKNLLLLLAKIYDNLKKLGITSSINID